MSPTVCLKGDLQTSYNRGHESSLPTDLGGGGVRGKHGQLSYNEINGMEAKHKCISFSYDVLVAVFRDVAPRSFVQMYQQFRGTCHRRRHLCARRAPCSRNAARSSAEPRYLGTSPASDSCPDGDTQHDTSVLLPAMKLLSVKNKGCTYTPWTARVCCYTYKDRPLLPHDHTTLHSHDDAVVIFCICGYHTRHDLLHCDHWRNNVLFSATFLGFGHVVIKCDNQGGRPTDESPSRGWRKDDGVLPAALLFL